MEEINTDTGEVNALPMIASTSISVMAKPEEAVERALAAKRARDAIIKEILVDGIDYGYPPGTEPKSEEDKKLRKPVLFKGGAEKISDAFNVYPEYEALDCTEDWDKRLWIYRYRCNLKVRGTDHIVASGIGSCNSRESRYRYRNQQRTCPSCGEATIFQSKDGTGWFCWAKKGGCGKQFPKVHAEIASQQVGKVENDDIESIVNTIDKMAQKRAFVAANLCLGFSAVFTQDLDDYQVDGATVKGEPKPAPAHPDPDIYDQLADPIREAADLDTLKAAWGKVEEAKDAKQVDAGQFKSMKDLTNARKAVLSTKPKPEAKQEAGQATFDPSGYDQLITAYTQAQGVDDMNAAHILFCGWDDKVATATERKVVKTTRADAEKRLGVELFQGAYRIKESE